MAGRYIIDGYNLMHKIPAVRPRMRADLEGAREDTLHLLSCWAASSGAQITVVFDGGTLPGALETRPGLIKVIFSRAPEKADPLIKRLIDRDPEPRCLQIVSSDREISNYARLYSCGTLTAGAFYALISAGPEPAREQPEPRLSKAEISEWLDLFHTNNRKESP